MRLSHCKVILLTLLLSTTYILGIDLYDQKANTLGTLYEAVQLPGLTYNQIEVSFSGINEGQVASLKDFVQKGAEAITAFSHGEECSKLCTQLHDNDAQTSLGKEDSAIKVHVEDEQKHSLYELELKANKKTPTTSFYVLKLHGTEDIGQLELWRQAAFKLYDKWRVSPSEYISFKGCLQGTLSVSEQEVWANTVMKNLHGEITDTYIPTDREDMVTYYGYTKDYKDFIRDHRGQKANTQISFIYNEEEDSTTCMIAFPFYNEPF
ncbi:hypothetical protein CS063_13505 [Sporanaerobium hydrogeniformans]|uniref:Uncharacterized protein n=1 Tax=Sporanaerobium hydrogeniformans TaxID=3072179 RepID=A0AC61DAQ8_9FIRM|nr:YwmB family TATA-box binding protein [Sporanaerobium hydrogeniformans]PHV69850.1 hypothetical protein CS063_13505 [Sporanaerobium hydrogeniformans]